MNAMIIRSFGNTCEYLVRHVLEFCQRRTFQPEAYKVMSVGDFTPRKMIQFAHEPSQPTDAHWCVALVPEDETATVTYLQGQTVQNLTLQQAELKATELNQRMNEPDELSEAGPERSKSAVRTS